jgi:hypothetical protein
MSEFFLQGNVAVRVVQDNGIEWEFHHRMTQDVVHLVNQDATMIGEDVEVTELTSDFGIGQPGGKILPHIALITRKLSRGVVADLFAHCHPKSHWAMVGSPGIGKSWTVIYALQQALMYNGAFVVFTTQPTKQHLTCSRRHNKMFVWKSVTDDATSIFHSNILGNSKQVLVLFDPQKVGTYIYSGDRRLIHTASNNETHFQHKPYKFWKSPLRFLSPYTSKELSVALLRMHSNCNLELAKERSTIVGCLPRYLVDTESFPERSVMVENVMRDINQNPEYTSSLLSVGKLFYSGHTNPYYVQASGTILAVVAGFLSMDNGDAIP